MDTFSLLTAIPHILADPIFVGLAQRAGCSVAEVIFRWCLAEGMVVLTGTTSEPHMALDLSAGEIDLSAEDLETISQLLT